MRMRVFLIQLKIYILCNGIQSLVFSVESFLDCTMSSLIVGLISITSTVAVWPTVIMRLMIVVNKFERIQELMGEPFYIVE